MAEPAPTTDRDALMLAELAELDLSLARKVHAAALAAEEPAAIADLGRTYQRIARSLRQTLALKARLEAERARLARAAARREAARRVLARQAAVQLAVERAIWDEHEGPEAERLRGVLDELLDTEALTDGFLAEPLPAHIARLRAELGLRPPAAEVGAASPPGQQDHLPGAPSAAAPDRESSA